VEDNDLYLSLGSNLGERALHLSQAIQFLKRDLPVLKIESSPLDVNPALVPPEKQHCLSWHREFFNCVLMVKLSKNVDPEILLGVLKKIEKEIGRQNSEKWAPRIIDIDILLWGDLEFYSESLCVPHPELMKRSFVLKGLEYFGTLKKQNKLAASPYYVGVLNYTEKSFSNTGPQNHREYFQSRFLEMAKRGVAIIDIGLESTRPGATLISACEERRILEELLPELKKLKKELDLFPKISLDSRHLESHRFLKSHDLLDVVNDVSALSDLGFLNFLAAHQDLKYVLMHSLSVPADPKNVLSKSVDVIEELKTFFTEKIKLLKESGVHEYNLLLDPGLGFGKSQEDSFQVLKRFSELQSFFPSYFFFVGHSRKSFLNLFLKKDYALRDPETYAVSKYLMDHYSVDYLRVHNPELHLDIEKMKSLLE